MAKSFGLEIEGLDKLKKKLNGLPARIKKEIDLEIDAGANEINAGQLRLVPVDEGRLKQSLSVSKTKDLERELVTNAFYAPYIEFGTKSQVSVPPELTAFAAQFKGGGQGTFAEFIASIKAWVKRKGIDERAAGAIAFSIITRGIRPHPFFFPPFFNEKPKIIKNVAAVIKDL